MAQCHMWIHSQQLLQLSGLMAKNSKVEPFLMEISTDSMQSYINAACKFSWLKRLNHHSASQTCAVVYCWAGSLDYLSSGGRRSERQVLLRYRGIMQSLNERQFCHQFCRQHYQCQSCWESRRKSCSSTLTIERVQPRQVAALQKETPSKPAGKDMLLWRWSWLSFLCSPSLKTEMPQDFTRSTFSWLTHKLFLHAPPKTSSMG